MVIIPSGIDYVYETANIYLIRFKGIPIYVGKTCKDIRDRFNEHYNRSKPTHIHEFMSNYSKEDFSIELLEIVPYSSWGEREDYWINYYDTLENGLNYMGGGKTNPMNFNKSKDEFYKSVTSENFREVQRKNGYSQSQDTRNKISESCRHWYADEDNRSKFKEKMTSIHGKSIAMIDDTGNVLKKFPSLVKAAEYIGKTPRQAQCLGYAAEKYDKGKLNSKSFGYKWSYKKCRD